MEDLIRKEIKEQLINVEISREIPGRPLIDRQRSRADQITIVIIRIGINQQDLVVYMNI
jgi:hypothetical protein